MKHSLKLISIFSLVVLAGCSTAELTSNTNVGNAEVLNINDSINTNSDDEISNNDWLLYEDERYGFNFRYPESFTIHSSFKDAMDLAEKNVQIFVYYKYDLPKYENQYEGMANYVSSQESFDTLNNKIQLGGNNIVTLANGYKAEKYIGGTEGSNLVEKYYIIHNDHLITFVANAVVLLDQLGMEREHYGDSGVLSSETPREIVEYFETFDEIMNTVNLDAIPLINGNENFAEATSINYDYTVFDDCGEVSVYANETWFPSLAEILATNKIETKEIYEMCYSAPDQIVIMAMAGGYCKTGEVAKYNIHNNELDFAERLNYNYGCVTSPTSFGSRTGQIISMSGNSGDAGCWSRSEFQYNFVTNQYRRSHSESACDQEEAEFIFDY